MFENRFYRENLNTKNLVKFEVKIDETDIFIWADCDLSKYAFRYARYLRYEIKKYIQLNLSFFKSLKPMAVDHKAAAIIQAMQEASLKGGVGPMAAVAGALAEFIGRTLRKKSREVIVENGGDIYLDTRQERLIQVYSGKSSLSQKIALRIKPEDSPLGICTSSASVGHSLSFGRADASCVISKSAPLADAFATALGNRIKNEDNLKETLDDFVSREEVIGALVIIGEKMAYAGKIEIVRL